MQFFGIGDVIMDDDLLSKIKSNGSISSNDAKKETEKLQTANEGFQYKNFSIETSEKHKKSEK
jgi:hypothetical protein